jgi:FkbM family methyltransferase
VAPPLTDITVGTEKFVYNHPHDVLGIVESTIFDVYGSHLIRPGWVVLDLGAGIGDFSVMASRSVGVSGTVIAIEPTPDDFECLLANLETNGCRNVIPIRAAVSDLEENLALSFKGRVTQTRARRLRDLIIEAGADPLSVRFAKVDIEGQEASVVPDNLDIFGRCERIAIELHNGAGDLLGPLMREMGFNFERITRRDYLIATLAFSLRHPLQAWAVLRAVRTTEDFHGYLKFVRGLEIVNSSELVVGAYVRGGPS